MSRQTILDIFASAEAIIAAGQHEAPILTDLKGMTVANLFYENSTRTWASFNLAAKRLGAEVLDLDIETSSIQKGESLLDTIQTLQAMACQLFVIRHSDADAVMDVAQQVNQDVSIINAGAGMLAHPTQALLDAFTIRQHKPDFSQLTIALLGDVRHSRVAKSLLAIYEKLGVGQVRLVGPEAFMPSEESLGEQLEIFHHVETGLQDVDVVVALRIQKERMAMAEIPNDGHYYREYGLSEEKLALAKPDVIVMHPAPINRGVEIASSVVDGAQSVIFEQVSNGVAIRMALMKILRGL